MTTHEPAGRPRASVVIVMRNEAHQIERCLDAVLAQQMPADAYEVIVVDNASADASRELVARYAPRVRLLPLDANYGFARGNNLGARQARGDWLIFLNADTEVEPEWLPQMLAAGDANPDVALLHAAQIYPWGQRAGASEPRRLFSDLCRWGFVRYYPAPRDAAPIETLFVSGATATVRRAWLEEAGDAFDETFFIYAEDRDLGLRANVQGQRVLLAPAAVMRHYQRNTLENTRKAWRMARLVARNGWRAYLKNMYLTEFLLFIPFVLVGCLLKPFEFPGALPRRLAAGLGLLALTLLYLPAALWHYAAHPEMRRAALARRRRPWGWLLRRLVASR
jgi:GT2 family glycosyltransferase